MKKLGLYTLVSCVGAPFGLKFGYPDIKLPFKLFGFPIILAPKFEGFDKPGWWYLWRRQRNLIKLDGYTDHISRTSIESELGTFDQVIDVVASKFQVSSSQNGTSKFNDLKSSIDHAVDEISQLSGEVYIEGKSSYSLPIYLGYQLGDKMNSQITYLNRESSGLKKYMLNVAENNQLNSNTKFFTSNSNMDNSQKKGFVILHVTLNPRPNTVASDESAALFKSTPPLGPRRIQFEFFCCEKTSVIKSANPNNVFHMIGYGN
jgi:hypothetical protein